MKSEGRPKGAEAMIIIKQRGNQKTKTTDGYGWH